jgi:hypothetical protein
MQLVNILRQRTEDELMKAYAVEYINSTQSFSYSYEKVSSLVAKAQSMVNQLNTRMGLSTGMSEFLELLELS